MFSVSDTIVAIATPPGRGGIGIVRISGPEARSVAGQLLASDVELQPRHATFARLRAAKNAEQRDGDESIATLDHGIVTFFPGPHSYTGEDVAEVSAHGSPVVLRAIVEAAAAAGARLAGPGEFTLRAFLNGRLDLAQAEAVADLIDAATPLQARAAFDQLEGTLTRAIAEIDAALFDLIARLEASVDFPEEGYHFVEPGALAAVLDALVARVDTLLADARRGRLVREGLQVAIVGAPNVGKSSLFNLLVGSARAIVTEQAGTTRDMVTEVVDLDGLRVTMIDTAGLRDSADPAEQEGVARSRRSIGAADLTLWVEDGSQPRRTDLEEPAREQKHKVLYVANKGDLPAAWRDDRAVTVSAVSGEGVGELRRRIAAALDVDLVRDRPAITNVRHIALVERARLAMIRGRDAARAADGSLPEEFVLADLDEARTALEEISGRRTTEELLTHIFSRFCIGK
jgi:tRNA modification GTPase